MRHWADWIKPCFATAVVAAALACADSPTNPLDQRALAPSVLPLRNVVFVGGQDYYADGGSGELVPTAMWPAKHHKSNQ